jgi:SET domain-containing protein|tara:strand:- start:133 stop:546 length:414 start_codon:yes stop_codon:yes gene_type:complete
MTIDLKNGTKYDMDLRELIRKAVDASSVLQKMYSPLPSSLTVKTSKVNGLGLFAKEAIPEATNLGMSHIKIGETIIRTPLGGFINHANEPNCIKVELRMTNMDDMQKPFGYKKWNLVTIKDIKEGEELTLKYTFYNI